VSDALLRSLERRAGDAGDPGPRARLLRERARAGGLPAARLALAAFLGDPAAGRAAGAARRWRAAPPPSGPPRRYAGPRVEHTAALEDNLAAVEELGGPGALLRAAVAACRLARRRYPFLPASDAHHQARAIEAAAGRVERPAGPHPPALAAARELARRCGVYAAACRDVRAGPETFADFRALEAALLLARGAAAPPPAGREALREAVRAVLTLLWEARAPDGAKICPAGAELGSLRGAIADELVPWALGP